MHGFVLADDAGKIGKIFGFQGKTYGIGHIPERGHNSLDFPFKVRDAVNGHFQMTGLPCFCDYGYRVLLGSAGKFRGVIAKRAFGTAERGLEHIMTVFAQDLFFTISGNFFCFFIKNSDDTLRGMCHDTKFKIVHHEVEIVQIQQRMCKFFHF